MIELQYALFQNKLGLCPNSDLKNPNIYTALADLRYLKLGFLLDQLIWVWNIKGLYYQLTNLNPNVFETSSSSSSEFITMAHTCSLFKLK